MIKNHKPYQSAVTHESTQVLSTELEITEAVIPKKSPKVSEKIKITTFSIQRS